MNRARIESSIVANKLIIENDTYHTQIVGDQTLSKAPQQLEVKLGTDFCLSIYRSAPSHLEV